MLLRHSLDLDEEAVAVESAISKVIENGARTADLAVDGDKVLSTSEMTEAVRQELV
jgi:3-isopropylmalate dehydrogenase